VLLVVDYAVVGGETDEELVVGMMMMVLSRAVKLILACGKH
jgi:hypothetical protein